MLVFQPYARTTQRDRRSGARIAVAAERAQRPVSRVAAVVIVLVWLAGAAALAGWLLG
ncbi:MAG: hypothetical protein REJ50_09790 [Bordetella sp.]|nr:hypothetical protein [Bordetella sp.]